MCKKHLAPTFFRVYYRIGRLVTDNFGNRSFNIAGPRVWNSLPMQLRQDVNFAHFKHQLETFLFWELVNHGAL